MEECGLPSWLVSHQSWSNMDASLRLQRIIGSTRSMKFVRYFNIKSTPVQTTHTKVFNRKRRQRRPGRITNNGEQFYEGSNRNTNYISSQITCHKIVQSNGTSGNQSPTYTKLVAYQKVGW